MGCVRFRIAEPCAYSCHKCTTFFIPKQASDYKRVDRKRNELIKVERNFRNFGIILVIKVNQIREHVQYFDYLESYIKFIAVKHIDFKLHRYNQICVINKSLKNIPMDTKIKFYNAMAVFYCGQ